MSLVEFGKCKPCNFAASIAKAWFLPSFTEYNVSRINKKLCYVLTVYLLSGCILSLARFEGKNDIKGFSLLRNRVKYDIKGFSMLRNRLC